MGSVASPSVLDVELGNNQPRSQARSAARPIHVPALDIEAARCHHGTPAVEGFGHLELDPLKVTTMKVSR